MTTIDRAPTRFPTYTIVPVPQESGGRDLPTHPAHEDQLVAGEQFGAGDHDEDQAEREPDPGKPSRRSERELGAGGEWSTEPIG